MKLAHHARTLEVFWESIKSTDVSKTNQNIKLFKKSNIVVYRVIKQRGIPVFGSFLCGNAVFQEK